MPRRTHAQFNPYGPGVAATSTLVDAAGAWCVFRDDPLSPAKLKRGRRVPEGAVLIGLFDARPPAMQACMKANSADSALEDDEDDT